jgi:hypothetical protein
MIASSTDVRTMLRGSRGPMGASVVEVRVRHLATVVLLRPYRLAKTLVLSLFLP